MAFALRSSKRNPHSQPGWAGQAAGLSGQAAGLSGQAVGLSGQATGLSGQAVGLSGQAGWTYPRLMRLGKFLATAGLASRRASEEIIRQGRVTVDGQVVTDPARDVTERDEVVLDGRPLGPTGPHIVYMVNKPVGVVSTARDPQGRPTVVSLVPTETRLYPVGRLDANTTGLILLTNDGQLAHRLTHPRFEVPKTYRAVVGGGPVRPAALRALRQGVLLEDGMTAPARVRLIHPNTIELTIHEGRKRQVRRMCDAVGHPVRSLERIRFGPLELGRLKPGAHRRLTPVEVASLSG